MPSTLTEIENLAEFIAEQYLVNGRVDLERIAFDKNITIIHEQYDNYFLGQLVHENGDFFIHLNSDQLPNLNAPRARFTLAHDYGHYFIDDHRNLLKKGISLAFSNENPLAKKPNHEIEADHFAPHLLMPKSLFLSTTKKLEPGIDSILSLKNLFDTSFECTAIHYTKLDILPCMFIRWKADSSQHYCFRSDSLAKLTNISKRPAINVHKEYLQSLFFEIDNTFPRPDYIENVSPLSRWVSSIVPGSKTDLVGLEQTFKLGEYGGITFLIF